MYKVVLFIAALQVLPLLTTAATSHSIDPKDVAIIDGRRYYFSPIAAILPDAITVCMSDNMTLVALETESEYSAVQAYIADVLQDPMTIYLTSGTYQFFSWIWSSVGQHITYFDWAANEPTVIDGTTQSFLVLTNGLMYDNPPNYSFKFICEQI